MKLIIVFLIIALQLSCTHQSLLEEQLYDKQEQRKVLQKKYLDQVQALTVKDEKHMGFSNVYNFSAVLLSQDLLQAQLELDAFDFQWDDSQYQEKRRDYLQTASQNTQVFLSFFTPNNKNNNLDKYDALWKVFLILDGRKYEAKAAKAKTPSSRLGSLYPSHNGFSHAYVLSFAIPLGEIEKASEIRLLLTGNLASSNLPFKILPAAN